MNAVGISDAPNAARTAQPSPSRDDNSTSACVDKPALNLPLPTWDRDRLELRLGTRVLRQFKIPSLHEEMILAALEELNWPPRIDDPCPSHDDPSQLERAIASLNRRQRPTLVSFRLDDTGQGILWELSRVSAKSSVD